MVACRSYSHDSAEHKQRVLALADRLRANGVDARLDQYMMAPPEGLRKTRGGAACGLIQEILQAPPFVSSGLGLGLGVIRGIDHVR